MSTFACECPDCAPLPSTTARPSGPVVPAPTVQPPPRPGGDAAWPSLLASGLVPESLRPLCEARDALGRSRYGRPLETHNGRDAARDCLEELLDGAVYAWQVSLEVGEGYGWERVATECLRLAEWVKERRP